MSRKSKELAEVLVRTQANPSPETVTTFEYDGDGGRVMKTVTHPNDPNSDYVTIYLGHHYVCQGPTVESLACAKMVYANGQRVAMVQVDKSQQSHLFPPRLT